MLAHEEFDALTDLRDAIRGTDGDVCADHSDAVMKRIDGAARHYLAMRTEIATEPMHSIAHLGFSGERNEDDEFYAPAPSEQEMERRRWDAIRKSALAAKKAQAARSAVTPSYAQAAE